jgi:hypothetical protein
LFRLDKSILVGIQLFFINILIHVALFQAFRNNDCAENKQTIMMAALQLIYRCILLILHCLSFTDTEMLFVEYRLAESPIGAEEYLLILQNRLIVSQSEGF